MKTSNYTDMISSVGDRISGASGEEMARGLGWASIAIGLTELAAPKQVEELLGLAHSNARRGTLQVLGVREICHGIGILTAPENHRTELGKSVWARVAGDVLDTALLGVAATKTKKPMRFMLTATMVMGIGVLDMICAKRVSAGA